MENTVKQRIIQFIEATGQRTNAFEKRCGFSNGYIYSLKESPSVAKMERIFEEYPNLSRVWLLAGEGPMLNDGNTIVGDGSGNIDSSVNVNSSEAVVKAMEIAATQQEITKKSQEQIDRLLAIIEKLT